MARIRNIKPAFFKDTELFDAEQECGLPLRVAYAGLWTVADRAGRFKWDARAIKSDVLPYDAVDMEAVLSGLVKARKIFKYSCAGEQYGFIKNFAKHQFINKNEVASQLPEPPTNNNLPSSNGSPQLIHCETTGSLDTDTDGLTQTVVPPLAPPPKPRKRATAIPENFPDADAQAAALGYWADRERMDITVADEAQSFRAHHTSHGNRMVDWGQAWVTWYAKAIKFNRKPSNGTQQRSKSGAQVDQHMAGIAEIIRDGRAGNA